MKTNTQSDRKYFFEILSALILSIIGIFVLLYFGFSENAKTIAELENLNSGTYLVKGFVIGAYIHGNYTYFKISDGTNSIKAVVFDKILLNENQIIEGYCQLSEYKKEKECIFRKSLLVLRK